MPRQRAKRKAAPVELKDLDPTENITEGHAPTTSIPVQKRVRQVRQVNVTDVPPNIQNHDEPRNQPEVPLQGSLQLQVSTADQIAVSLMQQLKDSGFQLVNRSDNVQSSNITDNTLAGIFQTYNSNLYKMLPNLNEEEDDDDVLFKTSTVKITKNTKPK